MQRTPLQRWLQRNPQPKQLRCTDGDDEERLVKIGVLRTKWRDATRAAEGFARVEALDGDGAVLRVWEDPELADGEAAAAPPKGVSSEDARLMQFAKLLNDVADKSAARHADAYKMAFDLIAELARGQIERAQALERAWQKLVSAAAQDVPDGAQGMADQVVAQLLANALSGGRETKDPNGPG